MSNGSLFQQMGDMFVPTASREVLLDRLPTGNYIIVPTQQGLMIQAAGRFTRPPKLYGSVVKQADRILRTFDDRPTATGVLLAGIKGSGKTQTAREVSMRAYEDDIITIVVNIPLHGDAFNQLLRSITQPAIVLFDEFEKVYAEKEAQEAILTLLDGVMTSKKLFMMTVNDKWKINDHMRNRPGRLFYSFEFSGLENDFIREYCEDNLHDHDQIPDILKVAALFKEFNFDMLKAIVEEMNRYKETAFEVIEVLNAKPFTYADGATYEITLTTPGGFVSVPKDANDLPMANRNNVHHDWFEFATPTDTSLHKAFAKEVLDNDEIDDDEDEDSVVGRRKVWNMQLMIHSKDLKSVDADAGRYEFITEDGVTVVFKKKTATVYNMHAY